MDIEKIASEHIKKISSDGTLQEKIESGVNSAFDSAIESMFRSYGSLTKQIEAGLEKGLQIKLESIPFEVYNEQMLVAIKKAASNAFEGAASDRFMSEVGRILAPPPESISLVDVIDKIVSFWKTEEPWCCHDMDDQASIEFEPFEYGSGYKLKLWKQKESGLSSLTRRTNSADLDLFMLKKADSDGYELRISHRQDYNPTCFHEHEAFVFKLYSAGTLITGVDDFDEDECNLTLIDHEH